MARKRKKCDPKELRRILCGLQMKRAGHPAGFSVRYTGVGRVRAKTLLELAHCTRVPALPRPGRMASLIRGVHLQNVGGRFEVVFTTFRCGNGGRLAGKKRRSKKTRGR